MLVGSGLVKSVPTDLGRCRLIILSVIVRVRVSVRVSVRVRVRVSLSVSVRTKFSLS